MCAARPPWTLPTRAARMKLRPRLHLRADPHGADRPGTDQERLDRPEHQRRLIDSEQMPRAGYGEETSVGQPGRPLARPLVGKLTDVGNPLGQTRIADQSDARVPSSAVTTLLAGSTRLRWGRLLRVSIECTLMTRRT